MKHLFIESTFLLMFLVLTGSSYAYDFEVDEIYYNVLSEPNLTVEVTYRNYYNGQPRCVYTGDIVIPETVTYNGKTYTVTRIGKGAFGSGAMNDMDDSNLKSITLPNTIESIGDFAFGHCRALKEINLPASVKRIEKSAFSGCNKLLYVVIPNGVEKLEKYTFSDCESLREVVIPSSVTSLGDNLFYDCNLDKCFLLAKNAPEIDSQSVFYDPDDFPKSCQIFVPDAKSYMSSSYWSSYRNQVKEIITIDDTDFTYTGKSPEINPQCNIGDYLMTIDSMNLSSQVGNNTGIITISFSSLLTSCEFNADIEFEYVINKAKLDININNTEREYGEENPIFSYSALTGFVNNEDESSLDNQPQLTCSATIFSGVGTYNITPSLNDTNYELNPSSGTLTIKKAPLDVVVNNQSRTYGSNYISNSLSYFGLRNNESSPSWSVFPQVSTDATKSSGIGQYTLTLSTAVASNYEFVSITPGILTITKAPLTIRAQKTSRLYFDENPEFLFSCIGLQNYETTSILTRQPTLTTDATIFSDCGIYTIYISGADAANYEITYEHGELSVQQRVLNASVGNYERCYHEENPEFVVTYSGFVNNENESVLSTKPKASTYANINSDTGIYTISLDGATAQNYKLQYTSGSLTIKPAEQTITWEQDLDNIPLGTQIELSATASSGLDITYISSTEDIAPIYKLGGKTYVDCMGIGTVQLRAYQEGNKNYNATQRVPKTLHIVDPSSVDKISPSEIDCAKQIRYNLSGQPINSNYKGIILKNGKKYSAK